VSHEAQPLVTQLRAARKLRHLSAPAVALKLGVSNATIYSWELGDREPPAAQLVCWAAALGYVVQIVPAAAETKTGEAA
jgi:transcriptional regulator with XRE-family HTH domain